ncbi:hypothetical protein HK096_008462, partial [Nowakowskiella sp. JEL0078]
MIKSAAMKGLSDGSFELFSLLKSDIGLKSTYSTTELIKLEKEMLPELLESGEEKLTIFEFVKEVFFDVFSVPKTLKETRLFILFWIAFLSFSLSFLQNWMKNDLTIPINQNKPYEFWHSSSTKNKAHLNECSKILETGMNDWVSEFDGEDNIKK